MSASKLKKQLEARLKIAEAAAVLANEHYARDLRTLLRLIEALVNAYKTAKRAQRLPKKIGFQYWSTILSSLEDALVEAEKECGRFTTLTHKVEPHWPLSTEEEEALQKIMKEDAEEECGGL